MSTAISATIGVTTLCAAAVQPWSRFAELWSDWWLGDALGALVVAPVILTMARTPAAWSRREWVETCLLVVGTAAISQVVFGQVFPAIGHHPLEYIMFTFVIAAAVRLGQPATALVVLGASGVTIWNTVRGAGPFAGTGRPSEPDPPAGVHGRAGWHGPAPRRRDCGTPDERAPPRGRVRGRRSPDGRAESDRRRHQRFCEQSARTSRWQFGALWLVDHDAPAAAMPRRVERMSEHPRRRLQWQRRNCFFHRGSVFPDVCGRREGRHGLKMSFTIRIFLAHLSPARPDFTARSRFRFVSAKKCSA